MSNSPPALRKLYGCRLARIELFDLKCPGKARKAAPATLFGSPRIPPPLGQIIKGRGPSTPGVPLKGSDMTEQHTGPTAPVGRLGLSELSACLAKESDILPTCSLLRLLALSSIAPHSRS